MSVGNVSYVSHQSYLDSIHKLLYVVSISVDGVRVGGEESDGLGTLVQQHAACVLSQTSRTKELKDVTGGRSQEKA